MEKKNSGWLIIGHTDPDEKKRVEAKMKILGMPICHPDPYCLDFCDKTRKYLEAVCKCEGIVITNCKRPWSDCYTIRWTTIYNAVNDLGLPMKRENDLDMKIIANRMDEIHHDILKKVEKEIPEDCPIQYHTSSKPIGKVIHSNTKNIEEMKDEAYDNAQKEVPKNYQDWYCNCNMFNFNCRTNVNGPIGRAENGKFVPADGIESDGTSEDSDSNFSRALASAIFEFCRSFFGDTERRDDARSSNCASGIGEPGPGRNETGCGCCSEPDRKSEISK